MAAPHLTTTPRPALFIRRPCPHCAGSGVIDAPLTPFCGQCGATWTPGRFDALMAVYDRGVSILGWRLFRGRRYHWRALPCGCSLVALRYRVTRCRMCSGTGDRYREATRDETLRAAGALPPSSSLMRASAASRAGIPTTPPMSF